MAAVMATAGAHAAAMAQAIKASGAIVRVEPEEFQRLIGGADQPVVIVSHTRFFGDRYQYLSPYKGLVLHTRTRSPIPLPGRAETIVARSIWIPQ
jgi:hypothetical protein